jgi:hypothetical protein
MSYDCKARYEEARELLSRCLRRQRTEGDTAGRNERIEYEWRERKGGPAVASATEYEGGGINFWLADDKLPESRLCVGRFGQKEKWALVRLGTPEQDDPEALKAEAWELYKKTGCATITLTSDATWNRALRQEVSQYVFSRALELLPQADAERFQKLDKQVELSLCVFTDVEQLKWYGGGGLIFKPTKKEPLPHSVVELCTKLFEKGEVVVPYYWQIVHEYSKPTPGGYH